MRNCICALLAPFIFFGSSALHADSPEQTVTELEQLPAELKRFTSITVKDPNFLPVNPTTVSWKSNLIIYHDESFKLESDRILRVENELTLQLARKGYQIKDDSENTQFYLQAIASLDENGSADSLGNTVGLSTGLGGHQVLLDTGALALVIVDKRNSQLMWRSKVQIFTDNSLPINIRNERLRMAVTELLSELPEIN